MFELPRNLLSLFHSQLFVTPPVPSTDCTGKTIIITGANIGLGKEAARHYLRLNAKKVILACRSVEKGEAAKRELEEDTKRHGATEEFAKRARSLDRLDTFIANAGISTFNYVKAGGNESTITVNVVSTFLLALLLLPKLQETARQFNITPTITIVSSELQFFAAFSERKVAKDSIFDVLNDEKTANMGDRYMTSKLLEVFVCREIAKECPAEQMGVTMSFVNPGWCYCGLMREVKSNIALRAIMRILCRTTEMGSRTLVHAGLAGPETHGEYLTNCNVHPCAQLVYRKEGQQLQMQIWKELSQKLNAIEPGVTDVLNVKRAA